MTMDRHFNSMEDRITRLEAIIDGSQAQAREATAYAIGLVTRYLHEVGLIDGAALRRYVVTFGGDRTDDDDHMGELVRHLTSMLEYHERHPSDFALSRASVVSET